MRTSAWKRILVAGVSMLGGLPALTQHGGHEMKGHDPKGQGTRGHATKGYVRAADAARACPPGQLSCATAATPAFAPDGALILAFTAGSVVSVARSTDLGKTFSKPVGLAAPVERMDTGADARPQIVVDAKGRATVVYAIFKDVRWNAEVLMAYSADSGRTFSSPKPIGENPVSQRFPVLGLDRNGNVFAAWLDRRNAGKTARARAEVPASLAFAWSDGAGTGFQTARLARDGACECCRIALAMRDGTKPVMLFRNVYQSSVRDHSVLAFLDRETPGPLQRVADDGWVTSVCPHHGPALAATDDGGLHAAWFTEGRHRDGLFYARSQDGGRTLSEPRPIGDPDRLPARPSILANSADLMLAWKEFDGQATRVLLMRSNDRGVTWAPPGRSPRPRAFPIIHCSLSSMDGSGSRGCRIPKATASFRRRADDGPSLDRASAFRCRNEHRCRRVGIRAG